LNALAEKIDFLRLKENEVIGAFGLLALLVKIHAILWEKFKKSKKLKTWGKGRSTGLLLLLLRVVPLLFLLFLVFLLYNNNNNNKKKKKKER
jgi:membrane protease YdiL (CAAX protease family)